MKMRLLLPFLLVLVGLSGCLPRVSIQTASAFLDFLLDPTSDTFNCFPDANFTLAFDVLYTGDPDMPPGRLELRQRGIGIVQLSIGNLRLDGPEWYSYELRGSGTHGNVGYTESYIGTLMGRKMMGEYFLMQEGCGTVRWTYDGSLDRDLDIAEEGGS